MVKGLFSKLKDGLSKTRKGFVEKVENLVNFRTQIDEELYEELEEILIGADVGVTTTMNLLERIRKLVRERKIKDPKELTELLKEEIAAILKDESDDIVLNQEPKVIMVVGVNGVGKTTTIGKLAHRFQEEGKKVLLAAGDTFRAAAIDQLEVWAGRANVEIIKHSAGADAAAVAYDAIVAAKSRGADVVLVDTAGRLHTKTNLMTELSKVKRVMGKAMEDAPHEVLLVLDATTGQNALSQTKIFTEAVDITGVVLTKLDGTAKGGIVIAIASEMGVPIKLIGVGEKAEDLRDFDPEEFVEALFSK